MLEIVLNCLHAFIHSILLVSNNLDKGPSLGSGLEGAISFDGCMERFSPLSNAAAIGLLVAVHLQTETIFFR
eukprot:snap_masked-scaffold_1-processed-gene-23.49-mRNA-1 protein AED:1.00 eAED:1.00 QI:0/0/0/0/1/1/2/0/71